MITVNPSFASIFEEYRDDPSFIRVANQQTPRRYETYVSLAHVFTQLFKDKDAYVDVDLEAPRFRLSSELGDYQEFILELLKEADPWVLLRFMSVKLGVANRALVELIPLMPPNILNDTSISNLLRDFPDATIPYIMRNPEPVEMLRQYVSDEFLTAEGHTWRRWGACKLAATLIQEGNLSTLERAEIAYIVHDAYPVEKVSPFSRFDILDKVLHGAVDDLKTELGVDYLPDSWFKEIIHASRS